MATLSRLRRSGEWLAGRPVTAAEYEKIDASRPALLNGVEGSDHSPTSPIYIGGAGLETDVAAVDDDDVTNLSAMTTAIDTRLGVTGSFKWIAYRAEFAAYAGKSKDFSSSLPGIPSMSFRWNNDGTRGYIVEDSTNTIQQFDFSTAYDISSGAVDADAAFDLSDQDSAPAAIVWKSDGTKFYVPGRASQSVFQYSCTTAWDVTTAAYDEVEFDISSQMPNPRDMVWNSDGSKFYLVCITNDTIYEYNCPVFFDLASATYNSVSDNVSAQSGGMSCLLWNDDGMRLYVGDITNRKIYLYEMTTAFDLSTSSYSGLTADLNQFSSSPSAMAFTSTGRRLHVFVENGTIYEYVSSKAVTP